MNSKSSSSDMLRRSYSMPTTPTTSSRENVGTALKIASSSSSSMSIAPVRTSKSQELTTFTPTPSSTATTTATSSEIINSANQLTPHHKLDRFGFILNMDSRGNIENSEDFERKHRAGSDSGNIATGGGRPSVKPLSATKAAAAIVAAAASAVVPHSMKPEDTTTADLARTARRIAKWDTMISKWNLFSTQTRRQALLKKRIRKGIPDTLRPTVWPLLCHVDERLRQYPGLYRDLVEKSIGLYTAETPVSSLSTDMFVHNTQSSNTAASANGTTPHNAPFNLDHTKSFKNIQETIERDIHRTFPRHSLFYSNGEEDCTVASTGRNENGLDDAISTHSADLQLGMCGATEISSMIRELDLSTPTFASTKRDAPHTKSKVEGNQWIDSSNANGDRINQLKILEDAAGQSRLRRVLKAYSAYDREIGYCQGMNFIAAMFLTLATEEKAFWMLVAVMNDKPCRMRGLFGEGMQETHQVLFIAEKLIHQFLPRLAKHLDKETIHVTMFATQWLLTQYTSSFRFDLVTRIWDCFLVEGWKITYRVMLSLLQHSQSVLLTSSFEDILSYFRELPELPEIGGAIVDEAIQIPLRTSHILKFEKQYLAQRKE